MARICCAGGWGCHFLLFYFFIILSLSLLGVYSVRKIRRRKIKKKNIFAEFEYIFGVILRTFIVEGSRIYTLIDKVQQVGGDEKRNRGAISRRWNKLAVTYIRCFVR